MLADRVQRFLAKSPEQRRIGLHRRIQDAASTVLFGGLGAVTNKLRGPLYLAYRPSMDYLADRVRARRFRSAWTHRARGNLGDLARLYAIVMNVNEVLEDGVPGDFAELGVFRGNSARVLKELMGEDRELFLFDTFGGFDRRDLHGTDARWGSNEFADTSLAEVRRFVGSERVNYVPGYFPDTVTPAIAARRFAVVHIDCDLKAPAKAALAFFYPRMSPGGLILLHDYRNPYFPGVREAVREMAGVMRERVVVMPDQAGTGVVRVVGDL